MDRNFSVKVCKHFLDPCKDSANEWWELPTEVNGNFNSGVVVTNAFSIGNVVAVSEGRII